MGKDYDVGVLFVHGIGEQARGDTLVGFGEPLHDWMVRWIGRDPTLTAISWARLTADPAEPDAPAAAVMDLPRFRPFHRGEVEDMAPRSHWLLAESNWARSFTTPSYADLARWSLQVLPFTLATHFGTRARRAWRRVTRSQPVGRLLYELARALYEGALLFLSLLVLMPLLVAVVLVVLALGLLPIPRLRAWVGAIQRTLSASIGDSFVLLASSIQSAAIVAHVQRDLAWLAERCRRVSVVAHSQGAAIAHTVLAGGAPSNVKRFCSVGSGLNKLDAIRVGGRRLVGSETQTAAPLTPWLAPIGMLVVVYGLLSALRQLGAGEDAAGSFIVAAIGFFMTLFGIVRAWSGGEPKTAELALPAHVRWVDFYASSDPVPNGALFDAHAVAGHPDGAAADEVVESRPLVNARSLLSDHTSYWKNVDVLVAGLAVELASLDPALPLAYLTRLDEARLQAAKVRRRWRARWLVGARLMAVAFAVAIPAVRRDEVRRMATALRDAVEWVLDLLPFVTATADDAALAVGAITVALMIGGAYLAVAGLWRWWDHTEIQRLYLRWDYAFFNLPFILFLVAAALGVEFGVFALAGWGGDLLGIAVGVGGLFLGALLLMGLLDVGRTNALSLLHRLGLARPRPPSWDGSIVGLAGIVAVGFAPMVGWQRTRADDPSIGWWLLGSLAAALLVLVVVRLGLPDRLADGLAVRIGAGHPALVAAPLIGSASLLHQAIEAMVPNLEFRLAQSEAATGSDTARERARLEAGYRLRRHGRAAAAIAARLGHHDPSAAEWLLRGTAWLGVAPAAALAEATGDTGPLEALARQRPIRDKVPVAKVVAWRDRRWARRRLGSLAAGTVSAGPEPAGTG